MLDCEVKNEWIAFLEFIQTRCTKAEYENWFTPIQMIAKEQDTIFLEVPNIFVQEYLLNNYQDLLRDFIPSKPNGELALSFVITTPQKKMTATAASPTPIETESQHAEFKLNPLYRFETFIEGPSNQFVKSAALGVAARPGKTYNPLFIHGGVGLGKTHLLHAIGHSIRLEQKKLKIHAITTEAFINEVVDSLRTKSIDRMKRFYRTLDILLIDDIQFLQNRLNFEEEFCNTFETLINQSKQIVITSDKPPSQLKLSERIIARMEWGLVAHMDIPDLETRVAIIKNKAEQKELTLSNDLAFYIAEHIYHNVRQLEGAINRLCAYSRFQATPLSIDAAEKILNELILIPIPKRMNVDLILQNVAAAYELRTSDLKGESRQKEIALARQIAMYLAKELLNEPLIKIADAFGGKTHSTLIHSWKKISEKIQQDEDLNKQIQIIRRTLQNSK